MKIKRNKKPNHPYASYKKGEKPKKEKKERPGRKETNWKIQTETNETFTSQKDIFTKINDEQLIIGKHKTLFDYAMLSVPIFVTITMIVTIILLIGEVISNFSFAYIIGIFLCIYFLFVGVMYFINDYWELSDNQVFILNRLQGTATVHEYSFRKKETSTHPFGKIEIEVHSQNNNDPLQKGLLYIFGRNPWFFTHLFEIRKEQEDAYVSFFVWYMDKNRPLPPHSFFDPYREKDYKRRKAEGFPPPLYPSEIPIPEYKEK